MLVLVCGPSGAGKTSIIHELARRHHWGIVQTLTTRATRTGEHEKSQIATEIYRSLESEGKFFTSNAVHGNRYATLKSDVTSAELDTKPWMLDFPYQAIPLYFSRRRPLVIVVVPTSEEQLVQQLRRSGRESRLNQALMDLRAIHAELGCSTLPTATFVVENKPDSLRSTVEDVELIILSQLRSVNEALTPRSS